ncbi:MAG: carboxypeptidase regulatory-like domain-containing protein [Acidobacteria bacterium]|nr:carboxypeptidase regulatory-like domain-containing protein [Acidobacteriota bacterium]
MRAIPLLICAALASCFAVNDAMACTCLAGSSPCSGLEQAAAVFVGSVRSIEVTRATVERRGKTEEVLTDMLAHFSVERSFKGIPAGRQTADVGSFVFSSCGYHFEEGRRYIVYAGAVGPDDERQFRGGDLKYDLAVNGCSRTRPLPDGQDDVDLVEAMLGGRPESRIFGKVVLVERDLRKGLFAKGEMSGVPGVKIVARDGARVHEAVTDESGGFRILAVAPGRYEVRPVLGATHSGYLGRDPVDVVEIRPPGLCGSDSIFLLQGSGVIRGQLFDGEGRPAQPNIEVSLVFADSAGKGLGAFEGASVWTKDEGRYEFNGLGPGDYIVGVGLLEPPNWRSPYSAVYHHPSAAPGGPEILHLRDVTTLENIDIHLPAPIPSFVIRGVVVDGTGRPAAGARIEIVDVEYGKVADKPEKLFQTGADGMFAVTGIADRKYRVRAFVAENYLAGTGTQSEPVGIVTNAAMEPITLTLGKPGIVPEETGPPGP